MALITAQNVQKYYGSDQVLLDASLQLNEGERLCLVGPNGAGKTTLLRCILGLETIDAGSISLLPTVHLGILEQHASFEGAATVWDAAMAARPELLACRAEARALEDAWAATEHPTDEDLNRYTEVHDRLRLLGDEAYESDVKSALAGLGLPEVTWEQAPATLSGGQRTRLAIAHLLLAGTDILCLDEPTNHLDVAAIEWLEDYLVRYSGAVLVISHDRYFMDQVGTKVVELFEGRTKSYPGNYTQFVRLKEEEVERQRKVYDQQQETIQKLQIYIDRYRAGNRATMSKSRQKALARIDRVDRPHESSGPNIQFRAEVRSGDDVLQVRALSKSFDGREIVRDITFEVRRGERVAIIGANGTGKTTLLKIIAGELEADSGAIRWGMNTEPGYFAQEMDMPLDGDTVMDALMDAAPLSIAEARDTLAQFGFRGDDVFRELPVLSGGERNRLQLAVLLARGANTVLLDEPTNHLDLPSRDALQTALSQFAGTLLFVTHDRYLLHGIATRLLIVENGGVTDFNGTYDEYRRRLERKKTSKPTKAGTTRRGKAPKGPKPEEIEAEIQAAEKRIAALTKILANPATYADPEAAPKASAEYDDLTKRLPDMYAAWEAASEPA